MGRRAFVRHWSEDNDERRLAQRDHSGPRIAGVGVTVDTTVQTKAVAHPTDSHLLLRATEWLNRAVTRHGMKLRQSFARKMRQARREVGRLLNTGGHAQGLRWLKKMRTWLGRLIRDIRQKIDGDEALKAAFAIALERAG